MGPPTSCCLVLLSIFLLWSVLLLSQGEVAAQKKKGRKHEGRTEVSQDLTTFDPDDLDDLIAKLSQSDESVENKPRDKSDEKRRRHHGRRTKSGLIRPTTSTTRKPRVRSQTRTRDERIRNRNSTYERRTIRVETSHHQTQHQVHQTHQTHQTRTDGRRVESYPEEITTRRSRTYWGNRTYHSGSYFDRQRQTPRFPTPRPFRQPGSKVDCDELLKREDLYGKYSEGDLLDLGCERWFWDYNLTLPEDPFHPLDPHPGESCDFTPCYPATGDLLIGREDKLTASSTCGLYRKERFCIVSHLEDEKKCDTCDSRERHYNHEIDNIVYKYGPRKRTWWQSENGLENVYIQLDLDEEFHFTHLIIKFKTFRPAAMLIERSYDFGATWQVYRYFAHDCAESFPGVPLGPARHISQVICESRYSDVEPSTGGELIYRVLPAIRHPIKDPFGPEVQNLVKLTNLRINFTRLHTLGDNLLDQRKEIKEKYYYAIYNMVVRGSCSCYGHASKCVPTYPGRNYPPDMVHGLCVCTHNTKGANCQDCKDFYNDLPWKPAIGHQTNACKECNCNNHATKCHFDNAVFIATGNTSGGVCDDCEHNTMGLHCEHCKHFYYRDMSRDITDPYACQPCDCDPRGSLDNGMCDSITDADYNLEAGRCYCKANVEGRRCDRCRENYWDFQESNPEGCRACTCDILGTVSGLGCNQFNGECTCKRYVTGRDCNQCLTEHWGLSEDPFGCRACDCDPGGAYDNQCDVISGQCRCRPHATGRKCDRPDQGYFSGLMDFMVYEAELARGCDNCQVIVREPYSDRESSWTGLGFMRVYEGYKLIFDVDNIQTSMDYDIAVRYEPKASKTWDEAVIIIERPGPVDRNDKCANVIPQDDTKRMSLQSTNRDEIFFPPVCLERGKSYKIVLELKRYDYLVDTPSATILIDSIVLIPRIDSIPFFHGSQHNDLRRQEFERYRCGTFFASAIKSSIPEICKQYLISIGFYVFGGGLECGCDATGSTSNICDPLGGQCRCKAHIVGRRCNRCAPGTYGFGPSGCRTCDCDSVGALDNLCDTPTGQCKCRQNTFGRQCDECQPGFWNYPNCIRCECNGHADTCDSRTGSCLNCADFTAGDTCDRCAKGFYGDPRSGINIPCRRCPCPGSVDSGHSFAETCELDTRLQTVVCNCFEGYTGERCDRCANNYFGYPESPGGSCEKCSCSNNIDVLQPGNCDSHSGECLKCLFNTEGFSCDRCKAGFYGDAVNQLCKECVCNIMGTDQKAGACNRITGQCTCLPNVVGLSCDQCEDNHWKLASGTGCEPCDCDLYGSYSEKCNLFDGQCECKPGFGGRQCNECQQNYWGNPNIECHACNCDRAGSSTLQCHRNNGSCVCLPGIGGERCDRCARGYTGQAPYCDTCGECFENWDDTINMLRAPIEMHMDDTYRLVEVAIRYIENGTIGSAYTKQFKDMEDKIEEINEILRNANISGFEIETLQKLIEHIRHELKHNSEYLKEIDEEVEITNNRIQDSKFSLNDLKESAKLIELEAIALREKANDLRIHDVEGALTLTREAHGRSQNAQTKVESAERDVEDSKRERKRTEHVIEQGKQFFNRSHGVHADALSEVAVLLTHLEDEMPPLNEKVCGALADPCDDACGGAGCGKCGGLSCNEGAVTKAENALSYAEDTKMTIHEKEKAMNQLQSEVIEAKRESDLARDEAQLAFDKASQLKNYSESVKVDLDDLIRRIMEFINSDKSKPAEIRAMAEEVLAKSISLDPEQIRELARQINITIASLTNIDAILEATAGDLAKAKALEERANKAKKAAEEILTIVEEVRKALDDAKESQDKAKEAIDKANKEISEAEVDLAQIKSETSTAQAVANKSVEEVEELKKKLTDLRAKFFENEVNVKKAEKEAITANALAMQADTDANDLESKYNNAMKQLDDKAKASGEAKEKAEMLRIRANELAHNATSKLGELQEMEDEFNRNERILRDYSAELDELNAQMTSHLEFINEKAEYYRVCQN